MITTKRATALFTALLLCCAAFAEGSYEPSGTYLFATKDGQDLFLDIYNPSQGSVTSLDGIEKPSVIFIFGGGFTNGERDKEEYKKWYRMLNESGYRVVALDYRLGLKGVHNAGVNFQFIRKLDNAIGMAVEDLFSATLFLIDNAEELGIDPASIVISGSSAGAITSLQAEWEICNGSEKAAVLPEGFNYAGVMAFSGAVLSRRGSLKYRNTEPCPTFLCHGDIDKIVNYRKTQVFNIYFGGSDDISRIFRKNGYNYNVIRYTGHSHEISENMIYDFEREIEFLENNVMKKEKRIIDISIDDPSIPIPDWARNANPKDLYD